MVAHSYSKFQHMVAHPCYCVACGVQGAADPFLPSVQTRKIECSQIYGLIDAPLVGVLLEIKSLIRTHEQDNL